ncbi:hypothetical protein C8J56DRAFT_1064728 [Mycena floridula]|nr:hypothetical protein C8J56DRAFT_1064728 [Mycena floridula]
MVGISAALHSTLVDEYSGINGIPRMYMTHIKWHVKPSVADVSEDANGGLAQLPFNKADSDAIYFLVSVNEVPAQRAYSDQAVNNARFRHSINISFFLARLEQACAPTPVQLDSDSDDDTMPPLEEPWEDFSPVSPDSDDGMLTLLDWVLDLGCGSA